MRQIHKSCLTITNDQLYRRDLHQTMINLNKYQRKSKTVAKRRKYKTFIFNKFIMLINVWCLESYREIWDEKIMRTEAVVLKRRILDQWRCFIFMDDRRIYRLYILPNSNYHFEINIIRTSSCQILYFLEKWKKPSLVKVGT